MQREDRREREREREREMEERMVVNRWSEEVQGAFLRIVKGDWEC